MKNFLQKNEGFSLVEVILAGGIFLLIVSALVGAFLYGQESTLLAGKRNRALLIAEEGIEAIRNIRDEDFSNLASGTYGLDSSGGDWQLVSSPDTNGIFQREIVVSDVGGDPNRKNIVSTVTWNQNEQRSGQVQLSTQMTFWQEIVPVVGDWSAPSQQGTGVDFAGNQNGLKIQVQDDYAYVVNNGGTNDFYVVDISDTSNPQTVGQLSLSGTPNNLVISGGYAYVAADSTSAELQVIDISSPSSPSVVGTYNAPGNREAYSLDYQNDKVYLARRSSNRDEFIVVDVSTPSSPQEEGSLNLGANGYDVVVLGDYAFVASSRNAEELMIIDVSDSSNPSDAGSFNASGGSNAISIAGFDDTIVLGRADGSLHIFDVSSKSSPSEEDVFDAGSNVNDISLGNDNDYAFLASNENSAEFQIVDISDPSSVSLVGSANFSSDLNGLAYHPAKDRVFAVGDSNTETMIVIQP